jgi:hypothetical protein
VAATLCCINPAYYCHSETSSHSSDNTELTPEGIQSNAMELRARAWSRENLMRLAPSQYALLQMLAPGWKDWGWKIDPKFLEEALSVWGLKAA